MRHRKRSADFAAVLITVAKRRLLANARVRTAIVKKVVRRKRRIAIIFKERAVEILRAARRHEPHLRPAVTLVGFLIAGRNRKFARVVNQWSAGRKIRRVRANKCVLNVNAVARDIRERRPHSVDSRILKTVARRSRLEFDQFNRIARDERQLHDLLRADRVCNLRRRRGHDILARRHCNAFFDVADCERRRQIIIAPNIYFYFVCHKSFETGSGNRHRVSSEFQLRKCESPVFF